MNRVRVFTISNCLAILVVIAGLWVISNAQAREPVDDVIKPGDKRIRASRIGASVDRFILFRVNNGVRQPSFMLTRTISKESMDGSDVLILEQRYESTSGLSTDTSRLRRSTLEPLSYIAKLLNQTEVFDFAPTRVIGQISAQNKNVENIVIDLPERIFSAVALDELIQAVPIDKKSRIAFRLYNPGKQFLTNTLVVVGSEKIKTTEGEEIDTWIITLNGSPVPTRMWVAKNSQKLIKQRSELPNGDEFWKVRLYA